MPKEGNPSSYVKDSQNGASPHVQHHLQICEINHRTCLEELKNMSTITCERKKQTCRSQSLPSLMNQAVLAFTTHTKLPKLTSSSQHGWEECLKNAKRNLAFSGSNRVQSYLFSHVMPVFFSFLHLVRIPEAKTESPGQGISQLEDLIHHEDAMSKFW